LFSNEESINNLGESAYQGIVDSIMVELQQKYNLRPRETSTTSVPPKKILLRNKENEEVVTKQIVEKQVAQAKTVQKQAAQAKRVETKETKTKKTKNIETQTSTRKSEKAAQGFSLENKINKIKIPMSLVELAKNPIYKK
jgi:hypothetical protein